MVTPENAFEPTDDASRLAGTRSFSHHSQMHVDALRDALAMVNLGVGCFSSDRYLSECHRQFTGNVRASGSRVRIERGGPEASGGIPHVLCSAHHSWNRHCRKGSGRRSPASIETVVPLDPDAADAAQAGIGLAAAAQLAHATT